MKAEIKAARLAALFGLEAPKQQTLQEKREAATLSREAEAVVLYASNPVGFKRVNCKVCSKDFAVNRGNIALCSDECRKIHLGNLGLEWDPKGRTPEDRWSTQTGGPEPLVVPPPALELLDTEVLAEQVG